MSAHSASPRRPTSPSSSSLMDDGGERSFQRALREWIVRSFRRAVREDGAHVQDVRHHAARSRRGAGGEERQSRLASGRPNFRVLDARAFFSVFVCTQHF